MRAVDQHRLGRHSVVALEEVAETVCFWLQRLKAFGVCLFLGRIHAARCERYGDVVAAVLGGLFDSRTATQHDQIGQRHFLAACCCTIEVALDAFQR